LGQLRDLSYYDQGLQSDTTYYYRLRTFYVTSRDTVNLYTDDRPPTLYQANSNLGIYYSYLTVTTSGDPAVTAARDAKVAAEHERKSISFKK